MEQRPTRLALNRVQHVCKMMNVLLGANSYEPAHRVLDPFKFLTLKNKIYLDKLMHGGTDPECSIFITPHHEMLWIMYLSVSVSVCGDGT